MKLEPVITEKSLNLAKEGKYTFRVARNTTKHQVKKLIEDAFGVNVTSVKTIKEAGENRKTLMGRKRVITSGKKSIVTLKEKQKIDLFEESKK
jgi:large subunit ribosomal protein L23